MLKQSKQNFILSSDVENFHNFVPFDFPLGSTNKQVISWFVETAQTTLH